MKAEIISIGDELLIGQTINTNASWIGEICNRNGINVQRVYTISDKKEEIVNTFDLALNSADLVIVTGGLGPTKDDLTKHVIAEYFNSPLEIHIPSLQRIEAFFAKRNRPMLQTNIQQAELPKTCTPLANHFGTAPGMWMEKNGKILISLPGVPYEMKAIVENEVLPLLKERFDLNGVYQRTMLLQGIAESFLADKIKHWEDKVRERGLGLAYLPSLGIVRLRVTSFEGKSREEEVDALLKEIEVSLAKNFFGYERVSLSEVIGKLLRENGKTLATVESCTGGALAAEIVRIPNASDYFKGSVLSYDNSIKTGVVGVSENTLKMHGAVSEEVVTEMAVKGRELLGVDFCLATSGVAGPDGGTDEKPVGTVWIALATSDAAVARRFTFGSNREMNIQMSVLTALNILRCEILKI